MDVGVRELRNGLSRHLAEVRSGHTVTVTDHGAPIARIVPVTSLSRLERLIAEGRVRPAGSQKKPAPKPLASSGSVSDLVIEQRR